jgi:hypothetical protein
MLFRRLRNEDTILSAEDLFEFPEEQIDVICFNRGINIDQKFSRKIEDLRLWLSISNLRNVPHSLLLLSRIQDFQNDSFNIDSDETSDEILRRSKTETYYLESVKVFEKAFAIDRLEQILFKCHERRQVSKWNNNF